MFPVRSGAGQAPLPLAAGLGMARLPVPAARIEDLAPVNDGLLHPNELSTEAYAHEGTGYSLRDLIREAQEGVAKPVTAQEVHEAGEGVPGPPCSPQARLGLPDEVTQAVPCAFMGLGFYGRFVGVWQTVTERSKILDTAAGGRDGAGEPCPGPPPAAGVLDLRRDVFVIGPERRPEHVLLG